jgi:signal peptidase I
VGVPGDVVFMRAGKLFRNGRQVSEPYALWSKGADYESSYDMKIVGGLVYSRSHYAAESVDVWRLNDVPVSMEDQWRIGRARPEAIPAGKLLLLGDHRNSAKDGHILGLTPRASVTGRILRIFWPLAHARAL